MKKSRLGAVIAAGAMLFVFAGTALADGTVDWNGVNGVDAQPCTGDHAGQTHWIFNPGGGDSVTAAELWIDGADAGAMQQNGGGSWSLFVDGGIPSSAAVAFTGDLGSGKAILTISCTGETTTTTSSESTTTSSEQTTTSSEETTTTEETTSSQETTTSEQTTETGSVSDTTSSQETTSDSSSESSSTATTSTETSTSHTGSVEAATGTPKTTPPPTDTLSSASSPSDGSWQLFLLGAAGVLAGILLLKPASAKARKR
jgi:hypothetical protein